MKYGADYLCGKKYKNAILNTHPTGWAAGIGLTWVGNAEGFVEAMCKSGKFSEIVIHLAEFDYSHKYDFKTYVPSVKKRAKAMEAISKKYPATVLMLSPFCEHNHSRSKMIPLFNQLKQIAPSCLMVNSIWKGQTVPGIITEIHLENSKLKAKPQGEYTVSFDGFGGDGSGDSPDANIPKILEHYSDARHIRIWNFRYNGKFGNKDKTPLNQRKHWPSEQYLRGHNAMMKTREGSLTWPSTSLYKPFADDHGAPSPTKDNKAMAILPNKDKNYVDVKDSNGKKIAKMLRVKPDHSNDPKGPRYYSSLYAYELGDIAQKNAGSRRIQVDGMPLTDADLRSGRFKG